MAFWKRIKMKINGLWYPKSVLVGPPVSTKQVAERLSRESTVSLADVYAVLMSLGGVLGDYMSQGRSVKLDGRGRVGEADQLHPRAVHSRDELQTERKYASRSPRHPQPHRCEYQLGGMERQGKET